MFKKRECKHCKLSKAVANDAAVQFNKAESEVKKLRMQNEAMAKEMGDMKFALSVNAGEWSKTSAWQIAQIHTLEKQLQESRADLALADTMVRQQRRRLIDYGEYGNKCNHPQSL